MTTTKKCETTIARRRKEQVIEAAADCFRREGFHRSSMSDISAAAGMSSGHVYHYFESKEKIVETIVALERRELRVLVDKIREFMQKKDVISAIVDTISGSVPRYLDRSHAALKMEILAEAARNPSIAALTENWEQEFFAEFYALLGCKSAEMISRCEIASALLEGLSVRVVKNQHLDDALDPEMVQNLIYYIFTLKTNDVILRTE
ncbi:TetR/AcrR family transcriptional regulator [Citrobacter freundii]|uniref:TetR/AcrR family transcriptional regulator n=1 Tax=Citrobacter TaxID=544 RepID=UPI000C802767|nr:TetR/AcrR family transcriptional regulator [Citrobacter freundii]EMB4337283.1 TetR/AcrR family transcriptional regulator [Citrobacter freundii]MBJ9041929.1 TetR/AcrR family transcriptional regulator [Citrobacter freundii]NTY76571.1 TetR family transcriptional regulator [Citrobacter freundii]NUA13019.1 TetR family transcriptional regulator [Citrobacter freundii]PMD03446.1 TetR family transcriptional regulator [Citrobacter freundii]